MVLNANISSKKRTEHYPTTHSIDIIIINIDINLVEDCEEEVDDGNGLRYEEFSFSSFLSSFIVFSFFSFFVYIQCLSLSFSSRSSSDCMKKVFCSKHFFSVPGRVLCRDIYVIWIFFLSLLFLFFSFCWLNKVSYCSSRIETTPP